MQVRRAAMVRLALTLVVFVVAVGTIAAQIPSEAAAVFARVDELIRVDRYDEAIATLEAFQPNATTNRLRYELFWRWSSAVLGQGDLAIDAGRPSAEILPIFERGEALADQAISADPSGPRGYYWKAANIGKWGNTRGIVNSLFKAPSMRDQLILAIERDPNFADAYFVLGQLFAKVPGVISFGDTNAGVSMARLSVDLMEAELRAGTREQFNEGFYIQLASHLISRNWNQRRRDGQQSAKAAAYASATTPLARASNYEGTLTLQRTNDRSEARTILNEMITRLERVSNRTPSQNRRLKEARELLAGLR